MNHAWEENAACASVDPELWYPTTPEQATEALRICWNECPARQACLDAAMAEEHPLTPGRVPRHGIRGGFPAQARAQLQGRRTRKAQAAQAVGP
ncbi:WhiB family transcriptional regulator [Streptomyces sp. SBT349]|uniref:WhiB family transcriptional regulator n=1 Tax=Streptomyces sp. SBT349 TaxID=1580539 RepID=UPI00066B044E|nr:WhiB family transcriptional regulator [Streptomyces sp. SBT349]